MSYLDLIEEYPREPELTQFKKVLMAAKRAKDLHDNDKFPLADDHFTSPYLALQEIKEGKINLTYTEEEPEPELIEDDSDDGDEE